MEILILFQSVKNVVVQFCVCNKWDGWAYPNIQPVSLTLWHTHTFFFLLFYSPYVASFRREHHGRPLEVPVNDRLLSHSNVVRFPMQLITLFVDTPPAIWIASMGWNSSMSAHARFSTPQRQTCHQKMQII